MKRKVRVLDYDINVTDEGGGAWGEMALGISCLGRQEIRLCDGLDKEVFYTTLLHELIHIVSEIQGMGMGEQDVCNMTAGMWSLLRNNKKLVEEMLQ